ncbi:type IV secretion system protein [Sphingomonas crocodyli]|uniref:Type IV secretion system protein n=1 Tax=Sphingomonas crocodyli TaxID=1979270 RepID=A0A437LY05_9SPHN|nr:type IV secretion system protein [Sphingomonas crocodyli]RVT90299.1 type IV secretion system protein [Sphingomonas crocodyli]
MAMDFFSIAYGSLDATLSDFLSDRLPQVIDEVRQPLGVGLAIYLVFVGYAVLRGLIDEPWREWFYRILKLSLVWVAVSSAGYNAWIVQPLSVDAPNAITTAISGESVENAGGTFDSFFLRSDSITQKLDRYSRTFAPLNPYKLVIYAAGLLVWLLTGLAATIGFAITIFAKLALAIIVSLGPIFIALTLFNSTRGLFVGFLNQAFNYILLIGIIAAMTGLVMSLGSAAEASATAAQDPVFGSIIFDIYVLLGSIFFFQAPSIAAGIAGGAAAGAADFARQAILTGRGGGGIKRDMGADAGRIYRLARWAAGQKPASSVNSIKPQER